MGALVAFETTRLLEQRGTVTRLFVSAARPRDEDWAEPDLDTLDDAQIVAELRRLGGVPEALLREEDVVSEILRQLRADHRALRSYRPPPGARVKAPVTVLLADADPKNTLEQTQGWARCTAHDCDTTMLAGGHFALTAHDLVNRVLGYCSYQPFLLQMFGWRLVTTMHTRRAADVVAGEPPYVITRTDVVAVESDVDLKADISAAFHDTLHLDPRYNVIANVLAHHAHESGLDARLSDVDLREECLGWWDTGFAALDVEGFRAYLQEMVGLGVLAPNNDGRGWHLRSPNVLHMIGSKDDVITQLVGAATLSVPDEFIALETRPALPNGRRSPLTAGQIDDVLGDYSNQVRVILGSPATGIDDAAQAVRQAADVGNRFTVPMITSRRQFEEELVAGQPGQRRVVLTDLVTLAPRDEACTAALTAALEQRPQQRGVTRSAVIVAGLEQMDLWRTVIRLTGRTPALGTVTLRRHDRQTLRVWALTSEKFSVQERQERLLEVTGGWPILVERAAALVAAGEEEGQALTDVAAELASPAGAAVFVDAVGVTADEDLVKAFAAVLTLVDNASVTLADLIEAASIAVDDPETAVACLQALGVFDVDMDGKYRLEPLLVRSWPQRA